MSEEKPVQDKSPPEAQDLAEAPPLEEAPPPEQEERQPLNLQEAVQSLVSNLMAALRNSLIYSPFHAQVKAALEVAEKRAHQAFQFKGEVTFICIEKEILFEGCPMNRVGIHFEKLAEFMEKLGIHRLCLVPGLSSEELHRFILNLSGRGDDGKETESKVVRSSEHIHFGQIQMDEKKQFRLSHRVITELIASRAVSEKDIKDLVSSGEETVGERLTEVDLDLLVRVQDAVKSIASAGISGRVSARESLLNFVYYFLGDKDLLAILAPLKAHDELTFKHCVNVALLCGVQAQYLHVSEDFFHDVIAAGLFHDIGKLLIPKALLNKTAPLTHSERLLMDHHASAGAQILTRHPEVPHLALVAAYEHHIFFNGSGGYPKRSRCHTPHLVSQIVALADFFDALRTAKPYRLAQSFDLAIRLIKKKVGTQFDPRLAANFLEVLQSAD